MSEHGTSKAEIFLNTIEALRKAPDHQGKPDADLAAEAKRAAELSVEGTQGADIPDGGFDKVYEAVLSGTRADAARALITTVVTAPSPAPNGLPAGATFGLSIVKEAPSDPTAPDDLNLQPAKTLDELRIDATRLRDTLRSFLNRNRDRLERIGGTYAQTAGAIAKKVNVLGVSLDYCRDAEPSRRAFERTITEIQEQFIRWRDFVGDTE